MAKVTVTLDFGGDGTLTLTRDENGGSSESSMTRGDEPDLAIDTFEGMVLAHFCAGIDVTSEAYMTGLITVLDALGNNT